MGVELENFGGLLCPVFLTKTYSRKVSEADWNLDNLMSSVEEEIVARERIGVNQQTRQPPPRQPPGQQPQKRNEGYKSQHALFSGYTLLLL